MKSAINLASRFITLSSISLIPLFSGCVTTHDYNDLEQRYKETKQELRVENSKVVYERALNNDLRKELDSVKEENNKMKSEKYNFDNVHRLSQENSNLLRYYKLLEEGREDEIGSLIEDYHSNVYILIKNGKEDEARNLLLRNIQRTSDMLKKLVDADEKYGNEDLHLYPNFKTEAYKQIEESQKVLER